MIRIVPGRFLLADHAISRAMDKGALGAIEVAGPEQPEVFRVLAPGGRTAPAGTSPVPPGRAAL